MCRVVDGSTPVTAGSVGADELAPWLHFLAAMSRVLLLVGLVGCVTEADPAEPVIGFRAGTIEHFWTGDRIVPGKHSPMRDFDFRAGIEAERPQALGFLGREARPVDRGDARAGVAGEAVQGHAQAVPDEALNCNCFAIRIQRAG